MTAALDLDYNEDQRAVRDAVARFCEQVDSEQLARQSHRAFVREAWQLLAQLGVFAAAAPGHNSGGPLELCASCEALGEHAFPGPIAATYSAVQVLESNEAQSVIDGHCIVSLRPSRGEVLPFGPDADLFLAREGDTLRRAALGSQMESVETLGGEMCGRAALTLGEPLANSERGLAMGAIASAAYLAGAATRLIELTAEHAATRKQFGRHLGDFQAVAHPLADCAISTSAARSLARAAAFHHTEGRGGGMERTAAALLSASNAARTAAYTCHQVLGALGVTLEGPLFHFTRRIRQTISLSVEPAHSEHLLADIELGAD